ncbi:protein single-minded isoform X1 [Anopheles gambiae]|uniref:Aryl hydrocarbon receptor n=2 Tax=Anopheles coluzzii TaxID=1518534 RepID=A0A6E8VZZ7_ANOCL|nr:protein single-minded isoform X1 [Anopheles gambiae]
MKMSQLGTVYATKRRRRNGKSIKTTPKEGITKSNPSKRHRERLNAELDLLASLLPFEQNILSKLDRLSILRLSVSYLRIKSYFQVVMHKEKGENGLMPHSVSEESYRARDFTSYDHSFIVDSDMFLQALNGFIMILTCEGEVFFATHTIESYLGFHQSDIIHQSVYELVHSEDREELQKQLLWNSFLPADLSGIQLSEALVPEKDKLLERSFTVRFRCLLDNTSGFLRLDIRGRVKILHGQNKKNEEPPLALFAFCTPFGPPSLLEIPPKENMFKSKHKLDFSLVSMDHKGKNTLGYSDSELANMGGYDLVHYDDLAYVASAHQELLKTGASGMIAYRYQKKDGAWQWLQTSSRLVYKNSKPDFVICTHRQLMEEEGRDLLGKRTMDFKVSYLDAGISSTYFESEQLSIVSSNNSSAPSSPTTSQQRANRRYKTQLRDFLSTCRHKRKLPNQCAAEQVSPSVSVVDYIPGGPPGTAAAAAAVAAAAYSNSINSVYSPAAHFPGTAPDNVYMTGPVHSSNFYPMPDNLFHQYRLQGVSGYYPEYHTSTSASTFVPTNGLIPYDSYGITKEDTMRWHEGTKSYGPPGESGQSHPASAESSQQPDAPSGCATSEAPYLVSGFAAAAVSTDPRSPHVPKGSCHQTVKSVSPHSSEELVDPCCTVDGNATPTKDSIDRHAHHGSQAHHGPHSTQHHHPGTHHQASHHNAHHHHHQHHQAVQHHQDIQQLHPHTHPHSHPTHRHRNGDGTEEHKLGGVKSPAASSSPIRHNEPQRQTVLMWGTSYNNNSISGNDDPHVASGNGSPSYDYIDSAGNFNMVNLSKSGSIGASISSSELNNTSSSINASSATSTNANPNQTHSVPCEPPPQSSGEPILEPAIDNVSRTIAKPITSHVALNKSKQLQPSDSSGGNNNTYSGKHQPKAYANHSANQPPTTPHSVPPQQQPEPLVDGTTVVPMDPTNNNNMTTSSVDTKWYCTDDA